MNEADSPIGTTADAVVIGAGMAGLLAAAVLSGSGRTVTVLERDTAATAPAPRDGVPQGRQPHVLLHRGLCEIEELLPGLRQQLVAAGGVPLDTGNLAWLGERGWAPFGTPAFELVSATRPLVEHLVRERVTALPGVALLGGARVRGLNRPASGTGWLVERHGAPAVRTDLVVDASGRGSRMPQWLAQQGLGEVPATSVDAGFGYAGRAYAAPPGHLGRVAGVVLLPTAGCPAGGVALPVEGGRWLVAAVGAAEHRPPRDPEGFDAFLARLRDPALADFTASARPLGDIAVHRRTGNLRRHYDRMASWPDGLLVTGDSLCAFNPVYGQGITVAATQALLLRRALATTRPGWEHRLVRRLARAADLPWAIATGEDLRHTGGERRSGVDALFGRWSGEVDRLAAHGNVRAQRTLDSIYHLVGSPARLFDPALIVSAVKARLMGLPAPSPRPPLNSSLDRAGSLQEKTG
ncbi:NAD(P)/FAD-dependent oxidoreductase [Streptomyces sp. NPDC086033]|uniref:NAD(P)/FAD-dependent oxidoreductase n=1 Tax=Streptomyces sp. NPDC086033 TaxID=3365747 RepID=UPI0037D1EBFE